MGFPNKLGLIKAQEGYLNRKIFAMPFCYAILLVDKMREKKWIEAIWVLFFFKKKGFFAVNLNLTLQSNELGT